MQDLILMADFEDR